MHPQHIVPHLDPCELIEHPAVVKEAELPRFGESVGVHGQRTTPTCHVDKIVLLEVAQDGRPSFQDGCGGNALLQVNGGWWMC